MCKTIRKYYAFNQRIENFFPYGETLHITWKDTAGKFLGFSELLENESGLKMPEIIGSTDRECSWADRADLYRKDEEEILNTGLTKCIHEPVTTVTKEIPLLTFKTPLRRSSGLVDGIFQISFVLDQISFPDITNFINKLEILNPGSTLPMIHNMPNQKVMQQLTSREQECVYYLARRFTYKEIANELDISARTVEEHVRHIKKKLGCYNLSSILTKVFDSKKPSFS